MPRSTLFTCLRNLQVSVTPHAGPLLLRYRLGVMQLNAHSRRSLQTSPFSNTSSSESSLSANTSSIPDQIEPKLSLTFTCTVSDCGERSTHQFTKRAYQKGIVLVQCPGCKNRYASIFLYGIHKALKFYIRHLIADHLGWFKESTQDGKLRTIEDLWKAKGEKVQRGRLNVDGTVEYIE